MSRLDAFLYGIAVSMILISTFIIVDTVASFERFEPTCRNEFGVEVECEGS